MEKMIVLVVTALVIGQSATSAQGRGQAPRQEAASVAGKWSLAVKTPHGDMTFNLELALEGKKVSGWMAAEQFGRLPLSGEYVDAALTFSVQTDNGPLRFLGKLKDRDTLVGDLSGHAGDLPCTATRVKDKTTS
jgi:hypothetical protein